MIKSLFFTLETETEKYVKKKHWTARLAQLKHSDHSEQEGTEWMYNQKILRVTRFSVWVLTKMMTHGFVVCR